MAAASYLRTVPRDGYRAVVYEEIGEEFHNELRLELYHLHLENLPLVWFKFIFLNKTRSEVRHLLKTIHDNIVNDLMKNPYNMPPICPNLIDIWRWTELLEPENVKVVIVGLDPYFSYMIRDGLYVLASNGYGYSMNTEFFQAQHQNKWLTSAWQSITRMMCKPFDLFQKKHLYFGDGNLNSWYQQGVCMFDYYLTTRGESRAHESFGWKPLTRLIVQRLSEGKAKQRVFMFWGSIFRDLPRILDEDEHYVIHRCNPSACRKRQNKQLFCCSWHCWTSPGRNCFDEVDSCVSKFSQNQIQWDPLKDIVWNGREWVKVDPLASLFQNLQLQ